MAESNPTQVILTDDGLKIIKAQKTADNATSGVTNLNDPNLMSVIEKQNNVVQFAGLTSQYNFIVQNAKDEGIDTTAVTTAYNNLNQFMASILADPEHASDVDRVTYKKYQDAYNEELSNLQNALQNNANNKFASAASATSQAASMASQAFSAADSAYNYANSEIATQSSAIDKAQSAADSAFSQAQSAVTTANSTASEFGKVSQKADNALSTALSAQDTASAAVRQASSAAADSKDAKQIAGAVSQSYKTLTDGSTMTIAELQGGLAAKLTKNDLDGYATQNWAQNQIKTTADGINGTISSIKSTVDSHTTSINDFQSDSDSFKDQFTKVNGTLDKHTTDIGTLKADASSLSSNFDSLSSDNKTNQHDIGQLQASAKEFNSTLETVQTQVQNSAVGANLIVQSTLASGCISPDDGSILWSTSDFHTDYIPASGISTVTISSPDYTFTYSVNHRLGMYDADKKFLGWQNLYPTITLSQKNVAFIRISINFVDQGGTAGNMSDWLAAHRYKLEKGSVATDFSLNPADTATITAVSSLSQTVDGFKTDISKKLEQKDLNGYATQDWTQNQIKLTADGFSGTLSSVKNTVDSHTTSINDLKADSSSFKSQFTTVNDTIGKHTTDIGTLQSDAKSLSSNFDSLNTDNNTNKHDISELQQTSEKFSSTLETVKQGNETIKSSVSQLSSDINLRVATKDLIDQINIQAGNTLISSSGQLTLSGKTIYFDSDNPVIIPSANIDKLLVDKKLTTADISANTFSTNNETFTVDKYGAVVASNLTIRGVTNLVYNAALLGANGSSIPGWDISNNGVCWSNVMHDGVPSIGFNNTTGAGVWNLFAQTKLHPLNGATGQPYSASVWFLEDGSDTSLQYQFTLAFFDSNCNRIDGGVVGNTWNGIGSSQDWRYVTINNAVAPSNAAYVGLQYFAYNGHGNACFSSPMLTQTAQATGYQPDTGNVISAGEIDGSVINGSTINGTTINTPNLNLGDNGQIIGNYSVNDDTGWFQPINGSGTLKISDGYIRSTANILYYNKLLNGIGGDKWGHWASSTQFVPAPDQTHPDAGNIAESTFTPAFLKLDIFSADKSKVNSRTYIDGTGLYINDGGTQAVSAMLSDYELLSSGMAYLNGGIQMKQSASFTFGNLAMNGYHSISMLDGNALNFTDNPHAGANSIEITAKAFTKSSRLSIKHDITPLSTAESSRLLNAIDVEKFRYTHDKATYKYQYGGVIDDVNSLGSKQYSMPPELLNEDGTGINLDSLTGILIKRVQDQDKTIGELSMRLTKLEMKK